MRKMFRSALKRTAFAFLLMLSALGSGAHAGGFTACDSPFIFEGTAANIVPIEYQATSADQGTDDRLTALQDTAQRLAWLIKLDSWHQPTYGSLGVVAHMFLGRQCDPEEVLGRLLLGGPADARLALLLAAARVEEVVDARVVLERHALRAVLVLVLHGEEVLVLLVEEPPVDLRHRVVDLQQPVDLPLLVGVEEAEVLGAEPLPVHVLLRL